MLRVFPLMFHQFLPLTTIQKSYLPFLPVKSNTLAKKLVHSLMILGHDFFMLLIIIKSGVIYLSSAALDSNLSEDR